MLRRSVHNPLGSPLSQRPNPCPRRRQVLIYNCCGESVFRFMSFYNGWLTSCGSMTPATQVLYAYADNYMLGNPPALLSLFLASGTVRGKLMTETTIRSYVRGEDRTTEQTEEREA